MRKNIVIYTLLCGIAISGCSLDKEYLNGPNASSFPASKEEVQSGVFAAYKGLSSISAQSTPYPGLQDNATDIGASRLNVANYNYQQTSKMVPSNAWVKKVYECIYKTVARCNLVLDNIDKAKDKMTDAEYGTYKAELIMLRSYLFEWGCELYGDIPYIDHTLALGDTYKRTAKADVIANILDKDMTDELIDCLPVRFSKTEFGYTRIGRAAAYGLKARICLNWGRFDDAAKYADKAISLAEGAGYKMADVDLSLCGKDYTVGEPVATPIFGLNEAKAGDEWLWGIEFNTQISSNQHNSEYYSAPRIVGGCSYFSPTQAFIDAIQCIDGKSIVESPLYNWEKPWENRDPRLDLFCVRPGSRVLGLQFETNPSVKKVYNYNKSAEGVLVANSEATGTKSEYGANGKKGPCGYLWRKYLDMTEFKYNNSSFGTKSVCVLGFPIMRLPELYLVRAEANIESASGNLGQAKLDIEKVRSRVGMPTLTVSDRDGLRSALRYERMVELCNEGFRWFDIRRWGIVETVLSGDLMAPSLNGAVSNAKPTIDKNWHVTYSGTTWDGKEQNLRKFLTFVYDPSKDVVWPIPEDERVANPNITQNPGYAGAE